MKNLILLSAAIFSLAACSNKASAPQKANAKTNTSTDGSTPSTVPPQTLQSVSDPTLLRNADGSIRILNYTQSMTACPTGTHLPSPRELASYSQKNGAKGILEVSSVDPTDVPSGYELIESYDKDSFEDKFYFNDQGYKSKDAATHPNDSGENFFWSSDTASYNFDTSTVGWVFTNQDDLDGSKGFGPDLLRHENAVLCFQNTSLPPSFPQTDDGTYTTYDRNGKAIAKFTRIQYGQFGNVWKDPSGKIWSANQGQADNQALSPDSPNQVILDSAATRKCAAIGGKLPSLQDYRNLSSYFELNDLGTFSTQGLKDLKTIFAITDAEGLFYWTSTSFSSVDWQYYAGFYQVQSSQRGDLIGDGSTYPRDRLASVRCVNR